MRTISSFATAISFRSGLLVPDGTGRRGPWFLPASGVRHRGPGFGGREMAVLHQLDRDAVGRTDKGHMAVARRAVDRHAGVHQVLAGGIDIVAAIGEIVAIDPPGTGLRRPTVRGRPRPDHVPPR